MRTNSNHPITFTTNVGVGGSASLILNANRSVSVPNSLFVNGQPVVTNNDARLSDARAPAANSVVDASVSASAAIAQSKISGLTSSLAALAPLASPSFTGNASVGGNLSVGGNTTSTGDVTALVSRPGGNNVTVSAVNSGVNCFASVYIQASNVNEQAQLFVGQGDCRAPSSVSTHDPARMRTSSLPWQ